VAGTCKCGNKLSGFINNGELLDSEDRLAFQEGLCCMEWVSKTAEQYMNLYIMHSRGC
jgi:hypothetical protein